MKAFKFFVILVVFPLIFQGQNVITSVSTSPINSFNADPSLSGDSLNSPTLRSAELLNDESNNYFSLSPLLSYDKNRAKEWVPASYWTHPDFGTIPVGTVCKEVYEEIEKRTATERYFRKLNNPNIFYIQKSSDPINFYKDGNWLAIDPYLSANGPGYYSASRQPVPTALDIVGKRSVIGSGIHQLGFNHFSMIEYDLNGNAITYSANWSDHSVGNNGAYIKNIFPGIDMKIQYLEGAVKSSFLVQHLRANSSKIVFVDQLNLPNGFSIATNTGYAEPGGWSGDLSINNGSGQSYYRYGKVSIIATGAIDSLWIGQYSFSGEEINIHVNSSIYNCPGISYPLIIDPTVTYGPFAAPANSIGAGLSPAFCSNALVVSVPGGATCTDFSTTWQVQNPTFCGCGPGPFPSRCNLGADQIYLTSSCGGATPAGAPATIWGCACNILPNVIWTPTVPFGSSGCASMSTCIPPSCAAQNITYTIFLNQFSCGNAACGSCVYATNTCAHLNSWSVTIQAETVTQLTPPSSSNGLSFCQGNCTNLTAAPQWGVAPYTYSWAPAGGTTNPTNVCPPGVGTTTYTCTVTDACGVTSTNTVAIVTNSCAPIELLEFTAEPVNKFVELYWKTLSENNNDFFTVERSVDGLLFETVLTLDGAGTSSLPHEYFAADEQPFQGTSYYRLKQTDIGGLFTYSEVRSVTLKESASGELTIIPNPADENEVIIYFNSGQYSETKATVSIIDISSRILRVKEYDLTSGKNSLKLDITGLLPGQYLIELKRGSHFQRKILIRQ